tara:strand:+ start:1357 stop:1842 length:486 start_codon:yes stop_codon:yes gene_type:complete
MNIKIATHEEMYEVADLIIGAFGTETLTKIPELGDPEKASKMMFLRRYIGTVENKEPYICYIARNKEGELIGATAGYTFPYHWMPQMWGQEDFWYVKEEYRKGTVGIKLFKILMKWFEKQECDKVGMMHYSWNPRVGKFYEKQGFVPYEVSYVKDMTGETE